MTRPSEATVGHDQWFIAHLLRPPQHQLPTTSAPVLSPYAATCLSPHAHSYLGSALAQLRVMLSLLCVENAGSYRTHDLRRGHARVMQAWGATAREILEMGGWRSGACMEYLDRDCLVDDAVLEAHLVESDAGEDSD